MFQNSIKSTLMTNFQTKTQESSNTLNTKNCSFIQSSHKPDLKFQQTIKKTHDDTIKIPHLITHISTKHVKTGEAHDKFFILSLCTHTWCQSYIIFLIKITKRRKMNKSNQSVEWDEQLPKYFTLAAEESRRNLFIMRQKKNVFFFPSCR